MLSSGGTGMLVVFCSVACNKHLHITLCISAVVRSNVLSAPLVCAPQSWFYLMERFIFGSCVCVMHSLVHNLNPYLPDVLTQFF